jgi:hypothetical protein
VFLVDALGPGRDAKRSIVTPTGAKKLKNEKDKFFFSHRNEFREIQWACSLSLSLTMQHTFFSPLARPTHYASIEIKHLEPPSTKRI